MLAHKVRGGPPRRSRRARWRLLALVLVHVAALAHIAHWKVAGSTLSPLEPSEAGQMVELGYVNAGLVLFVLLILSTLVLGRFFCGWACHVVAYQDASAWLLGKLGIRPRPVRARLLVWIPVFAAVRMFVAPALVRLFGGDGFEPLELRLTTDDFWERFPGFWIGALTFVVDGFLLVWLLGSKAFCTYGCPYGAFFGFADRFARGRIRVTDACEGCGHCTATCTSNVRVHEEVARHRMVVDPGCMKCMDCVNVCPKDALYFGFGPAPARAQKSRRTFDFGLGEELLLGAVFLVACLGLNLFVGLPFLLCLGLGVLASVAAAGLTRVLGRRDFRLQHHELKSGGRLTGRGWAFVIAAGLYLAGILFAGGRTGLVDYHLWRGERLAHAADGSARGSAEFSARIADSRSHYERAERFQWAESADLHFRIGRLAGAQGRWDEAAARARAALALDPELRSRLVAAHLQSGAQLAAHANAVPRESAEFRALLTESLGHLELAEELQEEQSAELHFRIGTVVGAQGRFEAAEERMRRALALEPEHLEARLQLADLRIHARDLDGATAEIREVLARSPGDDRALARLGRVLLASPAQDEARYLAVETLIGKGEFEQAANGLAPLLAREPVSARARELQRQIDERPPAGE